MRKLTSLLLALALVTAGGTAFAQDAAKTVKAGTKALAKYNADMTDVAKLDEARTAALSATQDDPSMTDAWLLLGDVYAAEVASVSSGILEANGRYEVAKLTNPQSPKPDFTAVQVPAEATDKAAEAYRKAYMTAEKSGDKKKARDGLINLSSSLSAIGNAMLGSQRYVDSYGPLKGMAAIDDYFREQNEDPLFADDAARYNQMYITAVVAQQAGDPTNAKRLYQELVRVGHDEPAVYAGYSNMLITEGNTDEARKVIEAGRQKFPENTELLFSEINYYIKKEDFATLETKLQQAIAAEPDNVGLYSALGSVYMKLGGSEGVEPDASQDYYQKSQKYYEETLKRDPNNVDANYSVGSIYYNQAVAKSNEMNALGTSKADQVRYEALEKDITKLFEQALPYFVQAERDDPNDRNTLIALKEIYARQNNFEMSKKYKERLEASGM